jgi:hypothetical protein
MGAEEHAANPWAKEYEENAPRKRSDVLGMTWKQGDHTLRICPNPKGGLPFVKYTVHWIPMKTSKNNRPIIHNVKFKCPVCEFVSTLWSEVYRLKEEEDMNDKSPEVQKLMKQIQTFRGKKTYDMNVIHREDYKTDDGKIKIKRLVAGPTIWKPIIELGNSSKWGNPSASGERGYDLTVTVDGEKLKREYTILPDSERKALTDEEIEAIKTKAYDLAKLRVFSSPSDMLDIIVDAKPPLDGISLKKLKKLISGDDDKATAEADAPDAEDAEDHEAHTESHDEDEAPAPAKKATKPAVEDDEDETPALAKKVTKPDEDDEDVKEPDEDEDDPVTDKESAKDSKAFTEATAPAAESSVTLKKMDCRGTYDPEDVGCQECALVGECKGLKKEFKASAAELGIEIANMSGVEIEKALEKAKAKPMGKQGKVGKQGPAAVEQEATSAPKKRNLPF